MAGARICRNHRHNLPLGGEDELTGGPLEAPTKGSNTPSPSPPVFWAQTPAPPPVPTSTKELCQQLLKTHAPTVKLLEQNHKSGPRK